MLKRLTKMEAAKDLVYSHVSKYYNPKDGLLPIIISNPISNSIKQKISLGNIASELKEIFFFENTTQKGKVWK